jgi:hypothetical protein
MSKPAVFNWPAPSVNAVCLLQNTAGAGNLLINGALSNVGGIFIPSVVFNGITRTISLTSTNNLSGVTFTINGTNFLGTHISESGPGPNNDTRYTTNAFASVTSITVNGAVNAVSVGTGETGQTMWNKYDYYRPYPSLAVQVVVTGTISWTFNVTLDDVTLVIPTLFAPDTNLTAQTGNAFDTVTDPLNYYNITINSSTNGSLVATFIQQGVV